MASGNLSLNEKTFSGFGEITGDKMTLEGTTNKSFLLLALVFAGAVGVWNYAELFLPFMIPLIIGKLILAIVIIFKKQLAPTLAPIHAILEGTVIGVISLFFESMYPGIIIQAVSLTFGVFLSMFLLYKTQIIKATENFKLGVAAATMGIFLVYIIGFVANLLGANIGFIHDVGGVWGIIISLVIVGVAALNLVLDFDFIENGVNAGAPKYMEWYGAFSLMITLVWLYLEILRLIAKSRD